MILQQVVQLPAQGDDPPGQPVLVAPADQSTGNPTGITLSVIVSDPDADLLSVTFYGRKKPDSTDDFTLVGLPDTQYYTGELNGGSADIFYSQTQWIVENREEKNIVYVVQAGDCAENGDLVEAEWKRADTAMKKIEDPLTTLLADGIPYAVAVGNHDQTPLGNPNGTTDLFNAYFGAARFAGREYYGGHYGTNNDNSFQLFHAGGMDFLVITIEYDPGANAAVLNWADSLLIAHADRRAIIVSHYLIGPGNPGNFGAQGQAIYNQVKDNPNVFLMLGAHYPGEGRRTDHFNGDTMHTLLADYQARTNGGNGWLRLMQFSPANNSISVQTYSPWLDQWEQDADSEFDLPYNMNDAALDSIGSVGNVVSESIVEIPWTNLDPNTTYEWFVEVSDGLGTLTGPRWSFSTGDHQLDVKVFLEGPFFVDNMVTDLGTSIPNDQPYDMPPWNYNGTENVSDFPPDVVDWVLVELRDAPDSLAAGMNSRIFRTAALLKENGDIVSTDGVSLPGFPESINKELFVVIWHRNHLPVLSASPLFNSGGIFQYNFTQDAGAAFGGAEGYSILPGNRWGMTAGDGNADGMINDADQTGWNADAGYSGYLLFDLNLDRQSDNRDKNERWLNNLGKTSMVPD
ncbi:MAG: metallophosphoesterase [Bacteroidetes bacterium]|nr:metallophosphoesterase [Bacteroidota bacterium]